MVKYLRMRSNRLETDRNFIQKRNFVKKTDIDVMVGF